MDIYIIEKSSIANIPAELYEKYKQKKFTNRNKLEEHCFAYLMLDRILKEVYHISDRELEFSDGKPYLKNKEKFFSLSHCNKYIAICISDSECGIDIEPIKQREYKAIANRLNFNCSTLEEFYYEWTKYEAKYKLKGDIASLKQLQYDNCSITAVSIDSQELFEIYIQNGDNFSN